MRCRNTGVKPNGARAQGVQRAREPRFEARETVVRCAMLLFPETRIIISYSVSGLKRFCVEFSCTDRRPWGERG